MCAKTYKYQCLRNVNKYVSLWIKRETSVVREDVKILTTEIAGIFAEASEY